MNRDKLCYILDLNKSGVFTTYFKAIRIMVHPLLPKNEFFDIFSL